MIKKKIIIEGKRVHYVGYRPFLLKAAIKLRIPNYNTRKIFEKGVEKIIISVGGSERQVQKLVKFIKENHPSQAKVSDIREEETSARVMSLDDYIKVLHTEQLYECAHIPQIYEELKNRGRMFNHEES